MSIQLKKDRRYIAIDFEATGLDTKKDEPIQVGLVVADHDFRIVDSYQAFIKTQRDIKELKHIVGYITGLSLEKLEDALSKEEVGQEIKKYINENDVLIGHNVGFDIAMLQQCCDCHFGHEVDTFPLAQSMIQYPPSYALEVLAGLDMVKKHVIYMEKQAEKIGHDLVGSHDALHDSIMTLGLFRYFVTSIQEIGEHYDFFAQLLGHGDPYKQIFEIEKQDKKIILPALSKPIKKEAKNIEKKNPKVSFGTEESYSSRYVGHHALGDLLVAATQEQPCIIAFHTNQKVELAKHLMESAGISNIGFAKAEQYIDQTRLNQLANQDDIADFELHFLIKYLVHHKQGLRVLDLNTKHDYFVYQLVRRDSESQSKSIMLCSHGGAYRLLKNPDYADHRIFFFDSDWWHFSYNRYHSQPVDLNMIADSLEKLHYVYQKRKLLGDAIDPNLITELEQLHLSFVVFVGTLGIDVTKQFTGRSNSKLEMGPLVDDSGFYQSSKLWKQIQNRFETSAELLEDNDKQQLLYHYEQLTMVMEKLIVVTKKMQNNIYLHYSFSAANTYVDFQEFKDLFSDHHVLYLSHARDYFSPLGGKVDQETEPVYREDRDYKHIASSINNSKISGETLFILSSVKQHSKEMFEYFSRGGVSGYDFFVENITGGVGKNTYLIQQSQNKKIVIGGFYFLLHLFAKLVKLDTIIVYNAKGPMEKTILADIQFYGQAAKLYHDRS